jgi:hypothetical protein
MYEIKEFKSITVPFIPHTVHEVVQNGITDVNEFSRMIEVRWGGTELKTILSPGRVNSFMLVCSKKTSSFKACKGDIAVKLLW